MGYGNTGAEFGRQYGLARRASGTMGNSTVPDECAARTRSLSRMREQGFEVVQIRRKVLNWTQGR